MREADIITISPNMIEAKLALAFNSVQRGYHYMDATFNNLLESLTRVIRPRSILQRIAKKDRVRVLDIGCGDGTGLGELVMDLEDLGSVVDAVGISRSNYAVNYNPELSLYSCKQDIVSRLQGSVIFMHSDKGSSLTFIEKDVHTIDNLGKFDLIYSSNAFMHFLVPWNALYMAANALGEGGTLLVDRFPLHVIKNSSGPMVSLSPLMESVALSPSYSITHGPVDSRGYVPLNIRRIGDQSFNAVISIGAAALKDGSPGPLVSVFDSYGISGLVTLEDYANYRREKAAAPEILPETERILRGGHVMTYNEVAVYEGHLPWLHRDSKEILAEKKVKQT